MEGETVIAGVDTHKDVHVLCLLDGLGRKIWSGSFGADPEGYDRLAEAIGDPGSCMVVGVEGRMRISAGETMGFMGFLAAGMAGNNPLLLILSALLIGGLTVAGNGMEINTGLPAATMQILIMLVLLTIMTVGGKRKA